MKKALLLDVDILDTMNQILTLNTLDYRSDFSYDVELLEKSYQETGGKNGFLWLCHDSGTQLLKERNMFINQNSVPETFKNCSQGNKNVMAFLIEPQYREKAFIMGRITELNPHEYYSNTRMEAQDITNVLISFRDIAEPVLFPYEEYDSHYQSIYNRYGPTESFELQVKDEANLERSLTLARSRAYGDAELIPVAQYLEELAQAKAEDYKDNPEYFVRFQDNEEHGEEQTGDEEENDR